MPIQILMPALSPTMTDGKLAKWLKSEGDLVESGDVIAEIETDKTTMEVEAVDEGVVGKLLVAEGAEAVAINTPIAVLLEEDEDASAIGDMATAPVTPSAPATETAQPQASPAPAAATPPAVADAPAAAADRVFASPLARRIAAQNAIDLSAIAGSGPHGRIIKRDVEAAIASGAAAPAAATPAAKAAPTPPPTVSIGDPVFAFMPEFEALPNTSMRKVIASRLTESACDVPHFNLAIDVDIDRLLSLRKELNDRDGADYKISVNDFVIKAVALALKRVPDCNVSYTDDAILRFSRIDISVAVAIDGGLITPVIKNAGAKGLAAISEDAKALAAKARDGKLQPEEYLGGTFTISNLGMFGVKSFNSIINPPQAGILSVGTGEARAVVKNGALAMATIMSLTLAVDHRCIDGSVAAAFAKELKGILEDPLQLML